MAVPLAYLITFTCYGTWLHGDERGSVDDQHNVHGEPVLPTNAARRAREQRALADAPYELDAQRREITLRALCETIRRKGWALHAVHVRSNHVHAVVSAEEPPERIVNDLKTAASRSLNRAFPAERDCRRWTRHGSTRYLWTEDAIAEKVDYVLDKQGEPMARFPEHRSRARSAAE
jgi:REP element-mobilizing transposase RayT